MPPAETVEPSLEQERMLALLRTVAEESFADNPFFGEAPVPELQAQLDALPAGVPDLRRWLYHKLLGQRRTWRFHK